jgi:crotonobetainyl-CoA:carnitine CoA-transferase CaiB-like acyl-CoA transferase
MSRPSPGPFSGLRVIDCSTEIAGPYATKLLVEAGADVIKVEPPAGDPLRRWTASGATGPEGETAPLFQFLNASKRSIVIDVETAPGRQELLDLARGADLVVESYTPEQARRLGLSLDALRAGNPATSLVSITPFGRTGPWADRPSTEFTLQAAVGSTAYRGLPERGPVGVGGRFAEWVAGVYAGLGALEAHLSARNTGQGRHIDLSMLECLVLSMTVYHDLQSQWVDTPLGQSIEIPSIEPAKDGWVGFCTITGQQWVDFCSLIGRPDIGEDKRYLDAAARMQDLQKMEDAMHSWTRERTVDEIIELASLMRIPVAPVGTGATLPETDHLVARGVYQKAPGGFLQPRPPFVLHDTPARPIGETPALDEHALEIRAELGSRTTAPARGGSALPLEGLKVVDLTTFWAGPIAASKLATLGADVVKIESIQRPDGMRFAGAARREDLWEWSPVFHGANLGKRGITLQLDAPEGIDLIKRLIADADVVIENYSARVVENFGLGWEVVHALNPNAIMVRMPAFGLDGPWRDRTGFAMTIEQVSGLAWRTGYDDKPLVPRGACDPVGGMHATFALLMALEVRERTGLAQLVEVPLLEGALNLAAEQVIEYTSTGQVLTRTRNRGPHAAPQGVYRCRDQSGHAALAVATDAQWQALRAALGNPAWASDAGFDTQAGRRSGHDAIDAGLDAWFAEHDRDEATELLRTAGVPAQSVINGHDLSPHPQLEARGFFQIIEHPATGATRYPTWPLGPGAYPRPPHPRPAPLLGEHNEEVLREKLGLRDAELEKLREAKILGNRPTFM